MIAASLLQSSESHGATEIVWICWFHAHEIFHIIKKVENVVLLNVFVETMIFRIQKDQNSICLKKIFFNIINVFTVTFD